MKYMIRWAQLQGPTTSDRTELRHDLANAIVTFVVLFGTVAWQVRDL
jgi:hypothetical protein